MTEKEAERRGHVWRRASWSAPYPPPSPFQPPPNPPPSDSLTLDSLAHCILEKVPPRLGALKLGGGHAGGLRRCGRGGRGRSSDALAQYGLGRPPCGRHGSHLGCGSLGGEGRGGGDRGALGGVLGRSRDGVAGGGRLGTLCQGRALLKHRRQDGLLLCDRGRRALGQGRGGGGGGARGVAQRVGDAVHRLGGGLGRAAASHDALGQKFYSLARCEGSDRGAGFNGTGPERPTLVSERYVTHGLARNSMTLLCPRSRPL